jgi:hypothetical protein
MATTIKNKYLRDKSNQLPRWGESRRFTILDRADDCKRSIFKHVFFQIAGWQANYILGG